MKTKRQPQGRKEGGILLLVLLVMLLLTFLSMGLLGLERMDSFEAAYFYNRARAFWMAEAGLNELKAIVTEPANRRPLEFYGLVAENAPVLAKTVDGQGSYEVFVRSVVSTNASDEVPHYAIESIGRSPGGAVSVSVHSLLRLTTVSDHLWATHTEGSVDFVTGDHVYGKIKTNGRFNIRGNPEIHGHATTSAEEINYNNDGRDPTIADPDVFLDGVTFGAPETDFNPDLIDEMAAKSGMDPVEGPASVEFLPDGRYILGRDKVETTTREVEVWYFNWRRWKWMKRTKTETVETRTTVTATNHIDNIGLPGIEDNIIFVNGDVAVKGEVGGSVSVVSDGTISVVDDLVYASAPPLDGDEPSIPIDQWAERGVEPDADERLGLYAKEKVEIDYPDHQDGRSGRDVNIHAAIFVTEPPSGNDNWGFGAADRNAWLGRPYIHLYGSIVQYQRGVIGYGSSNGFYKDYHQDARFLYSPPPGSPFSVPEFLGWRVSK